MVLIRAEVFSASPDKTRVDAAYREEPFGNELQERDIAAGSKRHVNI